MLQQFLIALNSIIPYVQIVMYIDIFDEIFIIMKDEMIRQSFDTNFTFYTVKTKNGTRYRIMKDIGIGRFKVMYIVGFDIQY
jgi:hypothetical protein